MIQRTLVLIKPDGVQRGLIGEILSRFEKVGLKIVGMKMVWIDKNFAEKHYYDVMDRHGQRVLDNLTEYLSNGPLVAIVLEGVEAIALVRKLAGSTYPSESLPGTIRGDYTHISKNYANTYNRTVGNLIHASAKPEEAKIEIELWFTDKELHSYKTVHDIHIL